MGDVIYLWEPSVEAIISSLSKWLPEHGSVSLPVARLAVSVDDWRTAARKAGRVIGRPIRTRVQYQNVEAWIADWPRDERERELQLAEERRRTLAFERILFGTDSTD